MVAVFKKVLLFYCLLVFGCTNISTGHTQIGSIHEPPTKSFVKIFYTLNVNSCKNSADKTQCQKGEWRSVGSGISVDLFKDKTTILTAGHVCRSGVDESIVKEYLETLTVVDHTGTFHQSYVVNVSMLEKDKSPDLCILWVPSLDIPKVKISKKPPKVGDEIYYIGAPAGVYHPPTVPIFKGVFSGDACRVTSIITAPAMGGSSGAGVLNSKNELIGVVFAVNMSFHHITLSTSYYSTIIFLTESAQQMSEISVIK